MKCFIDANGYQVHFSENEEFGEAKHVLVLCRWKNQWVLTRHKKRGLEFPGGKREAGETIEEAATREVCEETGGKIHKLVFLGQYRVNDPSKPFIKSIYYAELSNVETKNDYLETEGPVFVEVLPENLNDDPCYSFIMKDEIVPLSLNRFKQLKGTIEEL